MTEEFDDSEQPTPRRRRPRPNRSNRNLWVILGGIGCLVLLVCGGLVAMVFWGVSAFTKDLPEVERASTEFFDAIKAGNLEIAYGKTTAAYQAQNPPDQFAAFIRRFETLSKHTTRTMNGLNIFTGTGGKQARIQMTLNAPNNATTCTLILVDEAGVWKINQISVP
jgi:hypothetical protein